jgi:DNA-directed RNA polymerase I, II, and III subunit RPABC1
MSSIANQTVGGLNAEASRLFRVRKTCLKMLKNRGYLIADEDINMTTAEFVARFSESPTRSQMEIFSERVNDPQDRIFVFFPDDEKVGVKPIQEYTKKMKEQNVNRAIIVAKVNLTPFARTAVKEISLRGYKLEYFTASELLVDITEHKLVPQHVVLTEDEKKELLDRYGLRPSQLPRIQVTDPIARYYGLKHEQVVKIVRPSETAGRYITYRICVA